MVIVQNISSFNMIFRICKPVYAQLLLKWWTMS